MKELSILARFPEQRYHRNGLPLEISGSAQGSSLAIAMNRAMRVVLQSPEMRHKSPFTSTCPWESTASSPSLSGSFFEMTGRNQCGGCRNDSEA